MGLISKRERKMIDRYDSPGREYHVSEDSGNIVLEISGHDKFFFFP
jgi:hypothetical protein